MEHGLRECCKSIHIGHILIQHDASMSAPQVCTLFGALISYGLIGLLREASFGCEVKICTSVESDNLCVLTQYHRRIDMHYCGLTLPATGETIVKAVEVLQEHGVAEQNITILNLFATPEGILYILAKFPKVWHTTTTLY
jgi:hypothetical protein